MKIWNSRGPSTNSLASGDRGNGGLCSLLPQRGRLTGAYGLTANLHLGIFGAHRFPRSLLGHVAEGVGSCRASICQLEAFEVCNGRPAFAGLHSKVGNIQSASRALSTRRATNGQATTNRARKGRKSISASMLLLSTISTPGVQQAIAAAQTCWESKMDCCSSLRLGCSR